jgi:DNA-directed RNA polymerase subunit RPC12/RpoP
MTYQIEKACEALEATVAEIKKAAEQAKLAGNRAAERNLDNKAHDIATILKNVREGSVDYVTQPRFAKYFNPKPETDFQPDPENINCLAGVVCPQCGNTEIFVIVATTAIAVTDDGSDFHDDVLKNYACGVEWDDDSPCRCPRCNRHGKLRDFQQE